jgi:catechol 2,3-dioxygenase-like lactoylglutathione lyase family enzyme
MRVEKFESLILYVSSLPKARAFYVELLRLPVLFEDEIARSDRPTIGDIFPPLYDAPSDVSTLLPTCLPTLLFRAARFPAAAAISAHFLRGELIIPGVGTPYTTRRG